MKKCYVAQAYIKVSNAGSKPSQDFEKILRNNGFRNIGLPSITVRNGRLWWIWCKLSSIIASFRVPRNAMVAIQYPEPRHVIGDLFRKIKKRGAKTLVLVHDLNQLRGWEPLHQEILEDADIILAHTPAMAKWLRANVAKPEAKITVLGVFDYLIDQKLKPSDETFVKPIKIAYAGRLDKSLFLEQLKYPSERLRLMLFGNGLSENCKNNPCIEYQGACSPEELPSKLISSHFGLVWDGISVTCCTGEMGNYLRYNAPYKLSSYLSAGLPVIVWSGMGMAEFVKQYGVGICVDSLNDIPTKLDSLTAKDYSNMRGAAYTLALKIRKGYFYTNAIQITSDGENS